MDYENAIEVRNLTRSFGEFSLDNVSFDLPAGCILGLIGENGAGKSTTIRLIMDTMQRDGGTVKVLGMDNSQPEFQKLKNRIGVVMDEAYFPAVIDARTVNRMMREIYDQWDEELFFGYIHRLELPENRQFKDFSRGMKMKLAISVAMAHHPELLILDEATSGLDPIVRDEILDIFIEFTREENHSVLISSHILSDLEKICDYIAFLHKGRLLFCEEKDRLIDSFGILQCTQQQLTEVPAEAVLGKRQSSYGASCLVRREMVSPAFEIEKAGIEDIMLYMVKGEKTE
ncbi:MAG: ABC transporter ATP-binding protein [Emergencia sp.]